MRTFNAATQTLTPRVWIGCLACYNAGELVGSWFNAVDAADVLPQDIHGVPTSHEELWVFDFANIPVHSEMSPAVATKWGIAIENIAPQWRPAFLAWVEDQGIDDSADLPDQQEFNEIFIGEFPDFDEFAEMIVRDTGMLDGIPDSVARYFDHRSFAEDLSNDYTVIDTQDFNVWVFENRW